MLDEFCTSVRLLGKVIAGLGPACVWAYWLLITPPLTVAIREKTEPLACARLSP
jgi:hypothetical protein